MCNGILWHHNTVHECDRQTGGQTELSQGEDMPHLVHTINNVLVSFEHSSQRLTAIMNTTGMYHKTCTTKYYSIKCVHFT